MRRVSHDVWAVVGGELGQREEEIAARRRPRPEAPPLLSGVIVSQSPLVEEVRWATRPVRRDAEVDAEAIPLARSLRWLRGESTRPNDEEIAIDDAFLVSRREHARAARWQRLRRAATVVAGLAALAALAPLARALL